MTEAEDVRGQIEDERYELLAHIERWLETPMLVLGFVWLVLLVVDFTHGLGPKLTAVGTAIWVVFIIDFALRFILAPHKLAYLRGNWLTAISLLVPALRVFRIVRAIRALSAVRAVRGAGLVRVLGSVNRAMRGLSKTLGRRGFGYVIALTIVVLFAGAAGMFSFERGVHGTSIDDYASALWWTAMVLTTMGSDYFPRTPEGRVLCLLLAIYGFAMFGYVAATLATYFVARDAEDEDGEVAGAQELRAIRDEIAALRRELQASSK
jgi:voltage-gated potassium channel